MTPLTRPVRDVTAVYGRNVGACGSWAKITVDVAPHPDGFAFVRLVDEEDLPREFADAAAKGIRLELGEHTGVRVTLKAARVHQVDPSAYGFEQAGRLAVRRAGQAG